MAMTFYMNEPLSVMRTWDSSPRIPKHVQSIFKSISDFREHQRVVAIWYLKNGDLFPLMDSMISSGFIPTEFVHAVSSPTGLRDNKGAEDNGLVVFDGNRRLVAYNILIDPSILLNPRTGTLTVVEVGMLGGKMFGKIEDLIDLFQAAVVKSKAFHKVFSHLSSSPEVPVLKYNPAIYSLPEAVAASVSVKRMSKEEQIR